MNEFTKLDALSAAAKAVIEATPWSANGRYRTANAAVAADTGEQVTCNLTQTKDRGEQVKTITQFKVDEKVTSRTTVDLLLGGRPNHQDINEELRVEFELQAPALIQAYSEFVKSLLARELEKRGPALPLDGTWDTGRYLIEGTLAPICDIAYEKDGIGNRKIVSYTLSEAKLTKVATEYGYAASLDWFRKTNEKVGALERPRLVGNAFGDIEIRGTRCGKAVTLQQQRVFKVSVLGKPYLQFPARLYVDAKFTPEKEYHALFSPVAQEPGVDLVLEHRQGDVPGNESVSDIQMFGQ
ncbi:hypothetical protein [Polaromonas sp.]|uniref:hypothetical protein n=1 Tax=Polaromonas sp. TaxID=1869339 RepID=UPI00352B64ED